MSRFGAVAIVSLWFCPTALAVPMEFVHQGRLLDSAGDPVQGIHTLHFSLYSVLSGGSARWTEAHTVDVDGGYYSVVLGDTNALDSGLFDADNVYLSISIDSGLALSPRTPLLTVPFAVRAQSADTVTGVVDSSTVLVNGTEIISSDGVYHGEVPWDQVTHRPAGLDDGDDDTLADLTCPTGYILRYDGTAFTCAEANDHTHEASDIVSGTIGVARLPVGTGAGTVAAGSHTHDGADIATGTVAVARLPVGTTAGTVAAGVHSHDGADIATGTIAVARLPVGTTSSTVASGSHTHDAAAITTGTLATARLNVGTTAGTVAAGDHTHPGLGGGRVLLGDWELDEASGTTFADSSGELVTLTAPTGGQSSGSIGHSGNAVNFSGGVLQAGTGNTIEDVPYTTLEAWVRPATSLSGVQTIARKVGGFRLNQEAGHLVFTVTGASGSCSITHPATLVIGTWAHASGYYNGREIAVISDDYVVTSACTVGPIAPTKGTDFLVGAESTSRTQPYQGYIDEVRLWGVAPLIPAANRVSTTLPVCDTTTSGVVSFADGVFRGCDGAHWQYLGGDQTADTYTFSTCGQTGYTGPAQSACTTAYTDTTLAGTVTVSSGIQSWTVPATGRYRITAWGAQGGEGTYNEGQHDVQWGGTGARMSGEFQLTQGTVLKIIVGQMGQTGRVYDHQPGGGGGGSFVVKSDNTPLVIAGGGGGGGDDAYGGEWGGLGRIVTSGETATDHSSFVGAGGTSGGGGGQNSSGDRYMGSGAGFSGNGTIGTLSTSGAVAAQSFLNGGNGGRSATNSSWNRLSYGGFGGGGYGELCPGGGGGYSGGGVACNWSGYAKAGGGGSYNAGTHQDNEPGAQHGDGKVQIVFLH